MLIRRYAPTHAAARRPNGYRSPLDQAFANLFGGAAVSPNPAAEWTPAMDISEHERVVRLTIELPGFGPEDVSLTVEDGVLTIAGERTAEEADEGRQWHRRERVSGKFRRTLTLPEDLDVDAIEAKYSAGVLTVHLPRKAEEAPAKTVIDIQTL